METVTTGAVLSTTGTQQSPGVASTVQGVPSAMNQLGAMPFTMPMLGQLPPIPRFTGEDHESGKSFTEWHEHFNKVAKLVGWDDDDVVSVRYCLCISLIMPCGCPEQLSEPSGSYEAAVHPSSTNRDPGTAVSQPATMCKGNG